MAENVKVAVRIRPFSDKETEANAKCVLDVADNQVCVSKPFAFYKTGIREKNLVKIDVAKTFSFDNIFWSLDDKDPRFCDQSHVYSCLGPPLVEDAFTGFNCCIFAYGQTGSGKTYTMLGRNTEDRGIIPRLCHDIFQRMKEIQSDSENSEATVKVVVSYMEIYNEKVYDLLDPKSKQNLKVREHPILGPYVDGLKQLAVSSYEDVEQLLISGSRQRTVAATSMNIESSRSHAIFMLKITQTSVDHDTGITGEKVSKVSLVDLAGSERASKSGAVGERLKEGSNINKSLSTLGLVIAALADQSANAAAKQLQTTTTTTTQTPQQKELHIPYRDSVLTWLLRDCLGGNTRTVLVATLSPAEDNLGETISTLRYADRAKRIVNRAVVNEDPTAKIIRELREEVDALRNQLVRSKSPSNASNNLSTTVSISGSSNDLSLIDRLDASERLMTEISRTWEDRLEESDRLKGERHQQLERLGIRVESSGIRLSLTNKSGGRCFLVNLNADPSLNEMLVYYLNQPGETLVCKQDSMLNENENEEGSTLTTKKTTIRLNGLGIQKEHAEFSASANGLVRLRPFLNAYTLVNDSLLTSEVVLKHGDNIQFGTSVGTLFRLNCSPPPSDNHHQQQQQQQQQKQQDNSTVTSEHENQKQDAAAVTVAAIEKQYELLAATKSGGPISSSPSRESLDSPAESTHTSTLSLSNTSNNNNNNTNSVAVSAVTGRVSKHQQHLMIKSRIDEDRRRRQERLKADLTNLRRRLIRTNTMVYEANLMASQYKVPVVFSPTLQIPPSMLEVTPMNLAGSQRSLLSEPAVLATSQRGTGYQRTLALSEFESVLTACRDSLAEAPVDSGDSMAISATTGWQLASVIDESSPTGGLLLIGVANIYLSALFYTIPFTYSAPIISTLGEACGTLTVSIVRRPDHGSDLNMSSLSSDSSQSDDTNSILNGSSVNDYNTLSYYSTSRGLRVGDFAVIRIGIVSVNGLDVRSVAMCRYSFWDSPVATSVQPVFFRSMEDNAALVTRFDDIKTFRVRITDEFIDYCADGALAIQVWSYPALPEAESIQSAVQPSLPTAEDHRRAIFNRLLERWQEVTGQLDVSVEIQELKGEGSSYSPVAVDLKDKDNESGGVYKLTQGRSRRVVVQVQPASSSTSPHLPLQVDSIQAVQFGCVLVRNAGTAPLDSYQQVDLDILLTRWRDALDARTKYLDEQLRQINNIRHQQQHQNSSSANESSSSGADSGGNTNDARRETIIFQEWSLLVAEKELSEEPEPGCGLPGAEPLEGGEENGAFSSNGGEQGGRELHRPVIFLDLPLESLTTGYPVSRQNLAGANGFLDKEIHGKFVELPVLKELDGPIGAIASWDPVAANWLIFDRPTILDDKIYAIVRLVVRLSHPTQMDVMVRKRICFTVAAAPPVPTGASKYFPFKGRLSGLSKGNRSETPECTQTTVTYDIISNLPLASHDVARRSVLAKMAADPSGTAVNTAAIEQYVRAVQGVESLMVMDRLRQQLALQKCIDVALGRSGVSQESALQRPFVSPSPLDGSSLSASRTHLATSSSSSSHQSPNSGNNSSATTKSSGVGSTSILNRSLTNGDNNSSNNGLTNSSSTSAGDMLCSAPPQIVIQAPISPIIMSMDSLSAIRKTTTHVGSADDSHNGNGYVDAVVDLAFPTTFG